MSDVEMVPGDPTPDEAEQQGRDYAHPAVPVAIEGPARVQVLPSELGVCERRSVTSTDPVKLLNHDLLRARAQLFISGGTIIVNDDPHKVMRGDGAVIPTNPGLPVELRFRSELWARASSTTATVDMITEQWSY